MMKTSRQGWTGLQRQQGTEFVKWLRKEKRLQAGFRVLAKSLYELLSNRVQTRDVACNVWAAVPVVMTHTRRLPKPSLKLIGTMSECNEKEECDEKDIYCMPEVELAYSWMHLLERYVRTWLALEWLVKHCQLPMGGEGVRVLDIGTGPGPSAFATHDFYVAMATYAEVNGNELWRQPVRVTCVESASSMNGFRHHLAEVLTMHGAPNSVLSMCGNIGGFESFEPTKLRRTLNRSLRNAEEPFYDEYMEEWDWEHRYTPEEASDIANREQRYRLFTFSNFLTKPCMVEKYETNLRDMLTDAHPGSVLLLIGGKCGSYSEVYRMVAEFAQDSGFSPKVQYQPVSSSDDEMQNCVHAEKKCFYRRLECIAGELPDDDCIARKVKRDLEGEMAPDQGTSFIHAYRK